MARTFSTLPLVKSAGFKLINSRYGSPYHIIVEATTKCNLKCRMCMRSKRESGIYDADMPFDLYASIISNLKYPTRFVSFVGLGEQLLNPQFFPMIDFAKKKGFEVSLTDNFTLMDKETAHSLINSQIDYLYASFDSVSRVQFEKIRVGASFDTVVENIRSFVEAKKQLKSNKPKVFFKSTISKENYSEVSDLIRFAEELGLDGIDFSKEIRQAPDYVNDPSFYLDPTDLPETNLLIILCEMSKTYPCQALSGCFVTFDGKVLPCDHAMQILSRSEFSRYQLGDVRLNNITEIWRSEKHGRMRRGLASGEFLPFCEKCPAFHKP
jgi:radical SAM protein with 4Fe4S-binding SPASM domain